MPTAKHWDTALVCKMLLGGEKKKIRTKTPPVPTCARLSFKLKIRYISILHPVKKKCIFCTQKRLKNTQNKKEYILELSDYFFFYVKFKHFGDEKRTFVQKHPLCQTLIQTEDKIHIYFLTFPADFLIPIIFSNLNYNCSIF